MTAFGLCNVIAWAILIASWISPYFIQDKQKARVIGIILSSLATGMFVAPEFGYLLCNHERSIS